MSELSDFFDNSFGVQGAEKKEEEAHPLESFFNDSFGVKPEEDVAPPTKPKDTSPVAALGFETLGEIQRGVGEFFGGDEPGAVPFAESLVTEGAENVIHARKLRGEFTEATGEDTISAPKSEGVLRSVGKAVGGAPERFGESVMGVAATVAPVLENLPGFEGIEEDFSEGFIQSRLATPTANPEGIVAEAGSVVATAVSDIPRFASLGIPGLVVTEGAGGFAEGKLEQGASTLQAGTKGVLNGVVTGYLNKKLGTFERFFKGKGSVRGAAVSEGLEEAGQTLSDPFIDLATGIESNIQTAEGEAPVLSSAGMAQIAKNTTKALVFGALAGGGIRGAIDVAQSGGEVTPEMQEKFQQEFDTLMEAIDKEAEVPGSVTLEDTLVGDDNNVKVILAGMKFMKENFKGFGDIDIQIKETGGVEGEQGSVDGNTVTIFADQASPDTIIELLAHEVAGHRLVRDVMGEREFDRMKAEILETSPELVARVRAGEEAAGKQIDDETAAEEVIAYAFGNFAKFKGGKFKIKTAQLANNLNRVFNKAKFNARSIELKLEEHFEKFRNDPITASDATTTAIEDTFVDESVTGPTEAGVLSPRKQSVQRRAALRKPRRPVADPITGRVEEGIPAEEGLEVTKSASGSVPRKTRSIDPITGRRRVDEVEEEVAQVENTEAETEAQREKRSIANLDADVVFGRSTPATARKASSMVVNFMDDKGAWRLLQIDKAPNSRIYEKLRMERAVPETFNQLMDLGLFEMDADMNLNFDPTTKGFKADYVDFLGEDIIDHAKWRIARRHRTIAKDKRGKFTEATIQKVENEMRRKGLEKKFLVADDVYAKYNKQMIKTAIDSGWLDAEKASLFNAESYMPIGRVLAEDTEIERQYFDGRGNGKAVITEGIKALKGGDALIDPSLALGNTLSNWAYLYSNSVANIIKKEAVQLLQEVSPESVVETDTRKEGTTVGYQEGGETKLFDIADKNLYQGLQANKTAQGFIKYLQAPAQWLRAGVTNAPGFMQANILRDTLSIPFVTRVGFKPGWDSIKGFMDVWKQSDVYKDMMLNGGGFSGGYDIYADKTKMQKYMDQIADGDNTLNPFQNALKFWEKVGHSFETAGRVGVYRRALEKGDTKLEAAFKARDVLDFSQKGASEGFNTMVSLVPFLRARITGLHRLSRASTEADTRSSFRTYAGALVGATAGYVAQNMIFNREEYLALTEDERSGYWHFWFGSTPEEKAQNHYRIPKPFEVGAFFSTIPETIMIESYKAFIEDEPASAAPVLAQTMFEIAHTFEFSGVLTPQVAKPTIETVANRNLFLDRNIVGQFQEKLPEPLQFNKMTSSTARELAELGVPLAPAKIDHWVRGTFGTLGAYSLMATDLLVTDNITDQRGKLGGSFVERGADFLKEVSGLNRFSVDDRLRADKHIRDYYEVANEVKGASMAINYLGKSGDREGARRMLSESKELLRLEGRVDSIGKYMQGLREAERAVLNDINMSREDQKRKLGLINQRRTNLTKAFSALQSRQ